VSRLPHDTCALVPKVAHHKPLPYPNPNHHAYLTPVQSCQHRALVAPCFHGGACQQTTWRLCFTAVRTLGRLLEAVTAASAAAGVPSGCAAAAAQRRGAQRRLRHAPVTAAEPLHDLRVRDGLAGVQRALHRHAEVPVALLQLLRAH